MEVRSVRSPVGMLSLLFWLLLPSVVCIIDVVVVKPIDADADVVQVGFLVVATAIVVAGVVVVNAVKMGFNDVVIFVVVEEGVIAGFYVIVACVVVVAVVGVGIVFIVVGTVVVADVVVGRNVNRCRYFCLCCCFVVCETNVLC